MDQQQIGAMAEALAGARRDMAAITPPDPGPDDLETAYQVQDALIARIGAPGPGWKVGCTNEATQKLLGADEPFAGQLIAPLVYDSPAQLSRSAFFTAGLEAEFAFRLSNDLPPAGAPYDDAAVADAIDALHLAIEVVDGRYPNWVKAGSLRIIADNGAHASIVLGPAIKDWQGIDFPNHPVAMKINGEEISTGTGANVLGNPLRSVTWLANHRAGRADGLKAGDIISTGSCCAALGWAEQGDVVQADFGALGTVDITFT